MRSLAVFLIAFSVTTSALAETGPCSADTQFTYPMTEILEREGIRLSMARLETDNRSIYLSHSHGERMDLFREAVVSALSEDSAVERDVKLLALIHWSAIGTMPMLNLTALDAGGADDLYLDVLDRTGLEEHAQALRDAIALYDGPKHSRFAQWTDGKGRILDQTLDAGLRAAAERFFTAEPSVLEAAEQLVRSDAALLSRYVAEMDKVRDDERLSYLRKRLSQCAPTGWTPDEIDAGLARLPQAHADLIVADWFLAESMNGSVHQFFFNSSGTVAPQMRDTFLRMDLPDHAAAIQRGMDLFPDPYPRDTDSRRDVMLTFDEAQDQALYDLTAYADDGALFDGMIALAKSAGLWPE